MVARKEREKKEHMRRNSYSYRNVPRQSRFIHDSILVLVVSFPQPLPKKVVFSKKIILRRRRIGGQPKTTREQQENQ